MAAPLLVTDGYKFSMAEAGWPLRRETFYGSHRKGGLQVLPFDVNAELRGLLPAVEPGDWEYLAANQYDMGAAFKAAIATGDVTVRALPKHAVFFDREPIFSVTGPSALVSWLEPLVLMWSYRIQVATRAVFAPERLAEAVAVVTCERQRQLVLETLDAVGVRAPDVRVDSEGYVRAVRARVRELIAVVGEPGRVFEVGLRAATCVEQHLLALEALKAEGVVRTSHVWGARRLGLVPVGTMGHEHVQRFGSDDAAFRAMVDRRPQRSSFLLDTYDTITSGLPAAFRLMAERGAVGDSIRYDSGDKEVQYRHAVALAKQYGVQPVHILEDGFDLTQTQRFEQLRAEQGVAAGQQVYGYGGYLVAKTAPGPFTRDAVAAVYKLSQTGHDATMKFGNESGQGKQSVPGQPVLFRRRAGASGPFGVVGQHGEPAPDGYELLTGAPARATPDVATARAVAPDDLKLEPSAATRALVQQLRERAFSRSAVT